MYLNTPSFIKQFSIIVFSSLLISCGQKENTFQLERFEQELFEPNQANNPNHYKKLQVKYGFFFNSFAEKMLNISEEEKALAYGPSLSKFVTFPGILQLKREVDSVFPNMDPFEDELANAMTIFYSEFPSDIQPRFVTFLSEFNLGNATTDSVVGIGLDFYLGEKYQLYPALEFPDFMVAKLRKEYLVPNTIKAFGIGKFEGQLTDKRFVAMMLFEGKIRYFMKSLLPDCPDSLIFSCSAKQLKWAKENESMIWAHFIQTKMIFNEDPSSYMRYFNDGPFTIANGVPQESAPAMGIYSGFKIIEKYMKENSSISLKELMVNNNWDEILRESAYKPK
jgi:hypothetical protein